MDILSSTVSERFNLGLDVDNGDPSLNNPNANRAKKLIQAGLPMSNNGNVNSQPKLYSWNAPPQTLKMPPKDVTKLKNHPSTAIADQKRQVKRIYSANKIIEPEKLATTAKNPVDIFEVHARSSQRRKSQKRDRTKKHNLDLDAITEQNQTSTYSRDVNPTSTNNIIGCIYNTELS